MLPIIDKLSLHISASTAGIPCYCLFERKEAMQKCKEPNAKNQKQCRNAKNQKETVCPDSPRCGFLFLQQCSTKKPNTQRLHAPFLPPFTAPAVLGPVVLLLRGVAVSPGSSAFLRVFQEEGHAWIRWVGACLLLPDCPRKVQDKQLCKL